MMLSVLYALLEGLSREMGIERTDIKGCLFYTSVDGCMIFSVVLYDAVAGGAGHVRRIVTADGQAFQRVLAKAISVVDNCDCNSSCYRCLRNYYNQKIHDNLNRNQASAFLHQWVGNMNPLPVETIRTHDLQSRSLTLYPTELRAHIQLIYYIGYLRLLQGGTRKTKKYSKFAKKAVDILRTR